RLRLRPHRHHRRRRSAHRRAAGGARTLARTAGRCADSGGGDPRRRHQAHLGAPRLRFRRRLGDPGWHRNPGDGGDLRQLLRPSAPGCHRRIRVDAADCRLGAGPDADGHCPRPDGRLPDRPDRLRHRASGTGPGLSALRQAGGGVTYML
ncbi:uncharacterized protein METZ01_LOCUS214730, partial [marine metagenome]